MKYKKIFFCIILYIVLLSVGSIIISFLDNELYKKEIIKYIKFNYLYAINFFSSLAIVTVIVFSQHLIRKYNLPKHEVLFYAFMFSSFFISLIAAYFSRGETIRAMLHQHRTEVFMDFFNSIQYGMSPYENMVIYPPLINALYGFIGRFVLLHNNPINARVSQLGALVFLIYNFIVYSLFYGSLKLIKIKRYNLFFWTLFFSLPFLFLLERGNSLILSIIFTILFIKFYRMDNSKIKILSYVSLSIAAGIKITPALFGILLLREKMYKESFKCLFLGIIIFNIPFIFTDGNIFNLIENLMTANEIFQGYWITEAGILNFGYGVLINLSGTFGVWSKLLNINLEYFVFPLTFMIFVVSILNVILNKNIQYWKVIALLCSIICLVPSVSIIYNICYFVIPLALFLERNYQTSKLNLWYSFLFALLFIPVINLKIPIFIECFGNDFYALKISTVIEQIGLLLMICTLLIDCFKSLEISRKVKIQLLITAFFTLVTSMMYFYRLYEPAKYFIPVDKKMYRSIKGVHMENGEYKYFKNECIINLFSKEIKDNGLLVNCKLIDKAIMYPSNIYLEIYINDILKKGVVLDNYGEYMIYVPICPDDYMDNLEIKLKVKNTDSCIFLKYVGPYRNLME